MEKRRIRNSRGFTLIELLIIIGIIAILASIVFVSLNPLAKYQDARNARRWSDVNNIISAIKMYQTEHKGAYLASLEALDDDTYYQIGTNDSGDCNETCNLNSKKNLQPSCVDISTLIDDGYIASIPVDPNADNASSELTKYYFLKNSNKSITVGACAPEKGTNADIPFIEVSR
jgi:prepilin-type N-terminal cleavage/methylation domain-containing protein